jgi:hypothetical protein
MATPMSEDVARLICPEAFRMRDEFVQAMDRLTSSTGASGGEVEQLREQVLQLANTTGLSAAGAADHLADLHTACEMASAAYTPCSQEPPVTGILDQIDDTLADWRGSIDAMRWKPEPDVAELTAQFNACAKVMQSHFRQMAVAVRTAFESLKPVLSILAEPRPSAFDARYRQRQINRRRRRK